MITIDSLTNVKVDGAGVGTVVDALVKLGKDKRAELLDALLSREVEQTKKQGETIKSLNDRLAVSAKQFDDAEKKSKADARDAESRHTKKDEAIAKLEAALAEAEKLNNQIIQTLSVLLADEKVSPEEIKILRDFAVKPTRERQAVTKEVQANALLAEAKALRVP